MEIHDHLEFSIIIFAIQTIHNSIMNIRKWHMNPMYD